jgi:hypothetical protein
VTPQTSPFPEWADLHESLLPFLGERAVGLFSYAIFDASGAAQAAATLKSQLTVLGNDVDAPEVTETERLLIDWGRAVALDPSGVAEEWGTRFERAFTPALRHILVRYAALTIATAVVELASVELAS